MSGKTIAAELVDQFSSPVEPLSIELPGGRILKFRQIQTYKELSQFNKKVANFVSLVTGSPKLMLEALKPYAPLESDEAIAAYTISELSVDPKFDEVDGLELLKAPWLVEMLIRKINENRMNYLVSKFEGEVEEGKDGSAQTDISETGS